MPAELRRLDPVSIGASATWALLVAAQTGWLPFARHAWAFNLWAYLPTWVGPLLAAAALLLCFRHVRDAVVRAASRLRGRTAALPRLPAAALGLGALGGLFWLLRETELQGDSGLLVLAARRGSQFIFPDIGATFMIHHSVMAGVEQGFRATSPVRVMSCVFGVLSVWLALRATRHLVGERHAPLAALFLLSGGLARVFAGHVEVYAVVIAGSLGYLWAALVRLDGRGPSWLPALALGVAIWIHASMVCLLPSLVLLAACDGEGSPRQRGSTRERVWRAAAACALAALPTFLFLAGLAAAGRNEELRAGAQKAVEILGGSAEADATRWWVRGWGGAPSVGTDVIFLSPPHLKYLVNAFHLMVPATLPVLLAFALRAPRHFLASPRARFLLAACAPLAGYATLLRPFWGPFDWDLFSVTGIFLAALAVHLLASGLPRPLLQHVAVWLVGFQILFVGLPFLAGASFAVHEAGPFLSRAWVDLRKPATPPPEELAPWL